MSRQYKHSPLPNAERYIRLLRIVDFPKLSCVLETWLIPEAPSYTAISYVWGSAEHPDLVQIDEMNYEIGQNCHEAFQQSAPHASIIWIDSICINQKDPEEKAIQVRIMGSIFQNAYETFACVGPHADDSEFLLQVFNEIDGAPSINAMPESPIVGSSPHGDLRRIRTRQYFDEVMVSMTEDLDRNPIITQNDERFALTWIQFGQRKYWRRLWIIQEIWLSRWVVILCGRSRIRLDAFTEIMNDVPWAVVQEECHRVFAIWWKRNWEDPTASWRLTHMWKLLNPMWTVSRVEWRRTNKLSFFHALNHFKE